MSPHPIHLPAVVRQGLVLKARVTGTRRFAARAWVGIRLLILAGAVIGCDVDIEAVEK